MLGLVLNVYLRDVETRDHEFEARLSFMIIPESEALLKTVKLETP